MMILTQPRGDGHERVFPLHATVPPSSRKDHNAIRRWPPSAVQRVGNLLPKWDRCLSKITIGYRSRFWFRSHDSRRIDCRCLIEFGVSDSVTPSPTVRHPNVVVRATYSSGGPTGGESRGVPGENGKTRRPVASIDRWRCTTAWVDRPEALGRPGACPRFPCDRVIAAKCRPGNRPTGRLAHTAPAES